MPDVAYKATYRTRTYLSKGRVARTQPVPGLHLERGLLADGAALVGGIDEVGVGAWAGWGVAGAGRRVALRFSGEGGFGDSFGRSTRTSGRLVWAIASSLRSDRAMAETPTKRLRPIRITNSPDNCQA